MRNRFETRALRLTFALAVALAVSVGPGMAKAEGCSDIPDAPLAIDRNVFNGTMKGLIGADELLVSTRLGNAAWTGFYFTPSGATITAYVNTPPTLPTYCGDVITLANGNSGAAYAALEAKWPAGSVLVLPVATFEGARGTVAGFVTVQVIEIVGSGSPKFLHGTVLDLVLAPAVP